MTATQPEAPLLESGDRLSQAEFHRRYSARPDIRKAELVLGVVYVPSPVRADRHGEPTALMLMWLSVYSLTHPGVHVLDNSTVFLGDDSEVQPDACLYREGGSARLGEDGYIYGPPELAVEVAASSASYDLHDKLALYLRAGVREYLVWRTVEPGFDWLRLEGSEYRRVAPDADGYIESVSFPGLRLNVPALLAGNYLVAFGIAPP